MIEIKLILTFAYLLLWMMTFIFFLSNNSSVLRTFQVIHMYYFVLFAWAAYDIGNFFLPFHFLAAIQFLTAIYFTYKFVRVPLITNNKSIEVNKNFRQTIDEVFKNIDTNPQIP